MCKRCSNARDQYTRFVSGSGGLICGDRTRPEEGEASELRQNRMYLIHMTRGTYSSDMVTCQYNIYVVLYTGCSGGAAETSLCSTDTLDIDEVP